MHETNTELSLLELIEIKRNYLAQGRDNLSSLMLIVGCLGQSVELNHREYWIWQSPDKHITAVYSITLGRFMPGQDRHEETENLGVFLDCADITGPQARIQVCHLQRGDAVLQEEQVFIPGAWTAAMLEYLPQAQDISQHQDEAYIEAKRQRLMRELMIGKTV
jgi:hypothetical protein